MGRGDENVAIAKKHIGEKYKLGARARFLEPDFKGPWDCAEFVSWVLFQGSGEKVLLGCQPRDPARADAYTGFWADDAYKYGLVISVEQALKTTGATLLRRPTARKLGHIAISCGDQTSTVEAHSTEQGVIKGIADPAKRGWELGVRIPTPDEWQSLTESRSKPSNFFLRAASRPVPDPRVETITTALKRKGVAVPSTAGRFTPGLATSVGKFKEAKGIVVDGIVGPMTAEALGIDWTAKAAPSGTYNDKYGVYFDALVSGGFYSSDPDDMSVKRSIRTNNPGALNISNWQKTLRGYVGVTPPDRSPNKNRTTIYRTPEHGVAAWYVLLADRYGLAARGSFTLSDLARKYAGSGATQGKIKAYITGWSRATNGAIDGGMVFRFDRTSDLLPLARAMFQHEIGRPSPISDAQIKFGIEKQRSGQMPA